MEDGFARFECFVDGQPVVAITWKSGAKIPFDIGAMSHQVSPTVMQACACNGEFLLGATFPKYNFTVNLEHLPQIVLILAELERKGLAMEWFALGLDRAASENVVISEPYSIISDATGEFIEKNRLIAGEMLKEAAVTSSSKVLASLSEYFSGSAPLQLLLTHPVFWSISRKEEFLYVLTDRRFLFDDQNGIKKLFTASRHAAQIFARLDCLRQNKTQTS